MVRVVVVDDREAFASPERFPEAREVACAPWEEMARRLASAKFPYCVVVTRRQHDDQAVLHALLRAGARRKYRGLIGSRAKWAILSRRLRKAGVPEDFLARVRTPMGLPNSARTHGEIAVSVVAEMVQLRRMGKFAAERPSSERSDSAPAMDPASVAEGEDRPPG